MATREQSGYVLARRRPALCHANNERFPAPGRRPSTGRRASTTRRERRMLWTSPPKRTRKHWSRREKLIRLSPAAALVRHRVAKKLMIKTNAMSLKKQTLRSMARLFVIIPLILPSRFGDGVEFAILRAGHH